MKKITFALFALLAMSFTMKAQQYVSTEPANRNVVIEEFTGRNCGYCPLGHKAGNELMAAHPGRVWAINYHTQNSLSPTSYPNLNTAISATVSTGFPHNGIPTGVVNRKSTSAIDVDAWSGVVSTEIASAAECNVAGVVRINSVSRVAMITVEVYYTANSSSSANYLTVAMIQDSILGSQSDYGNYNPTQWLNGQYVHMHTFRDMVTPTWGEAITPTTAGTLITKTYEYQIPETIGSPNGVNVDLNNIEFLAWVSATGTPSRPILNACELETTIGVDQPIYPVLNNVAQVVDASCTHVKTFSYKLVNLGLNAITSVTMNATVAGETQVIEWTGNLAAGASQNLTFEMELPFGTYQGELSIVEANGEAFSFTAPFTAECLAWNEVLIDGDETTLQICIVQDQHGEQTTWDIVNLAGDVVANGGPYEQLMTTGVRVHTVNVTLPADEYLFRIYDSASNGICCTYGNGQYNIKDANGNYVIQGDGAFGAEARHLFAIRHNDAVGETSAKGFNIYPNPANNRIYIDGEGISVVEVYNSLGQMVTSTDMASVDVTSFENGIYVVRVLTNDGNVTTKKVTIAH